MLRGLKRHTAAFAMFLCVAAVFSGSLARACAFHLYKPEKTVIDWVIDTDHLVVARASRDDPFVYQVVQVLRGTGNETPINQLVDTRSRARLAANPDHGVLFAWDGLERQWRLIAYLTPAYREVVDAVLSEMTTWETAHDPARFEVFEALQDHRDPSLPELALRESTRRPTTSCKRWI